MIRGYQSNQPLGSEPRSGFQWMPALLAGFLAGVTFLLVPQGSPWSALTFFSPVIMGRPIPLGMAPPLLLVWLLHLLVALIYGLLVSRMVVSLKLKFSFTKSFESSAAQALMRCQRR